LHPTHVKIYALIKEVRFDKSNSRGLLQDDVRDFSNNFYGGLYNRLSLQEKYGATSFDPWRLTINFER